MEGPHLSLLDLGNYLFSILPPTRLKVSVRLWWSPLWLDGSGMVNRRANLESGRLCSPRVERLRRKWLYGGDQSHSKDLNPIFEGLCGLVFEP